MTSKQRHPTSRRAAVRQSLQATREALDSVAATDPTDMRIDPASALFFEYAGPLLLTARTEQEFSSAMAIAEFVWTATFLDPVTQAALLDQFIEDANIPDEMVPWLLEVYDELAARKEELVG